MHEGVDAEPSEWVKAAVHFEQPAQEATLLDYLHEVEHAAERIERLEQAIDEAVKTAPEDAGGDRGAAGSARDREDIGGDHRGRAGEFSRFARPRQLMGYSGAVASEDSSGERIGAGASPKRAMRTCGGSSWKRPGPIGTGRRWVPRSQAPGDAQRRGESDRVEGAASAARRYRRLTAHGKSKQQAVTAVGRELLGFIWAIGVQAEAEAEPTRRQRAVRFNEIGSAGQGTQQRWRPRGTRKGESSMRSYAAGLLARPAPLVRGSSRRITIMRFSTREYQSDQPSRQPPRLLSALLFKRK